MFTIVAEGLAEMVRSAVSRGLFYGFKVNNKLEYNLLQFADDTILIGEGTWENLWAIKAVLRGFELVSGLKTNMCKRRIYGIGIPSKFLESTSYFLVCRVDQPPFKF